MEILFTRNSSPLSRLIRHITKEPVSHCAINWDDILVTHMNLRGFRADAYRKFEREQEIVYRFPISPTVSPVQFFDRYQSAKYDYGALLYLGLRAICPLLPKANLWQSTGMFMCTELITDSINGEEDHLITPFQLYQSLSSSKGN